MHHVSIGSKCYEKSVFFYKTTLAILGKVKCYEGVYQPLIVDNRVVFKGARFTNMIFEDGACFSIVDALYGISDQSVLVGSTKGQHIAFKANCLKDVTLWHKKALELGATDNGVPGVRPHYGSTYLGAFVVDLDGFRIEACKMDYLARYSELTGEEY